MNAFITQIVVGMALALGGTGYVSTSSKPNYFIIVIMYIIATLLIGFAIAKIFKKEIIWKNYTRGVSILCWNLKKLKQVS